MFVVVSPAESGKHLGKHACLQDLEGKVQFKGVLEKHPEYGTTIKFGKGDEEHEPSFVELHHKILDGRKILLWAAEGEPNYDLLGAVKQEDPSTEQTGQSDSEASAGSEAAEVPDTNGPQMGQESDAPSSEEVSRN